MTTLLEVSRPVQPPLPAWAPLAGAAAGLAVTWSACTWAGTHVHADPVLHDAALFVHLVGLVVGFGAVLTIDWIGLLWMVRLRSLHDVLVAATNVQVPIWAGYGALLLSGVFLEPDVSSPLTLAKLVLVLLIGWNGLLATFVHQRLSSEPARGVLTLAAASATISQVGWWGAMLIGFLNHQ